MDLVLVDDHGAYRESLRIAIAHRTHLQVIGEASNAHAGGKVIEACRPDVAVVDLLLGDGDGVSLARELRRRGVKTPILILGRQPPPSLLRDALARGVNGYALKTESLEGVITAIHTVGAGDRYVSPQLQPCLEMEMAPAHTRSDPFAQLSRREREILCLLVDGHSSKDIARALYISARTVDAHRLHINRKLGSRSPAQLLRIVTEYGLLTR
jgi:two-component system response regulator NreC